METECKKVDVIAESKSSETSEKKNSEKKMDFGDKTGRTRRKLIKMRIQPASVFVDEGEDKIEVGKVRIQALNFQGSALISSNTKNHNVV